MLSASRAALLACLCSRLPCRLRSVPLLTRLADAVICLIISPRLSYRRAGRSGGSSLLACYGRFVRSCLVFVVGLFLSYSLAFARALRGRFPVVSSCLLRLVRFGYCSACGVVGHPRSSCVGMRGASSYFVAVGFLIVPVPFLVPSICLLCFSSLFAPSCDTAGGELLCGCCSRLARRSFLLLAVRGAGRRVRMACYHHGSFSPWGRAVWIMWLERLLAVLVVYWYCQLVVYIVRLDFRYG